MKIDKQTLAKMEQAVAITWHHLAAKCPDIKPEPHKLTTGDLQYLWYKTWTNIAYPDDNPNVMKLQNGKRLLPHDADFPLYPCGSSDTHVLTAMKAIARNI